jgi:hypothetical protein
MVAHPSQQFPVSRRHRIEARRAEDGGYRLQEDGCQLGDEPDASAAARRLFWRMHELVLHAMPEYTTIHAGCASWNGRRLLAAGAARSGKSTLMARLLYEGFDVHCDDLVLLHRAEAVPYPRRFFIRPSSVALIPQLATRAVEPFEWGDWEPGSLALDPTALGFRWRIEPGPVDAVLFLERGPDGQVRLETCPKYGMAERIMLQSNSPAGGPRERIRDVCAVVDRAECFVLRSGDLEASVAVVKDLLRGPMMA